MQLTFAAGALRTGTFYRAITYQLADVHIAVFPLIVQRRSPRAPQHFPELLLYNRTPSRSVLSLSSLLNSLTARVAFRRSPKDWHRHTKRACAWASVYLCWCKEVMGEEKEGRSRHTLALVIWTRHSSAVWGSSGPLLALYRERMLSMDSHPYVY